MHMQDAWNEKRRHATHERWIAQLQMNLPAGIPLRQGTTDWPETFRSEYETVADDEPNCTQCLFCRYYAQLEGPLGADWGACLKRGGQYDRQLVFEHWTCGDFQDTPDSQDMHGDWQRLCVEAADHVAAEEAFQASLAGLPQEEMVEGLREHHRRNRDGESWGLR